ncbi:MULTISPECIES: HAD-IC family P-type ATPase [unclassified Leifsonia]|uniref:HAD-IC family P-type ATPase n=1 Tax=unclassified Leifsonia TaxID=2663824 RepID=UPI0008A7ADD9|nr:MULTISPECIES: HAD-IC family P-type ATPase [unclassified Leifsonia]SEH96676.1 cation-transporting ATPase E [Leifsonia sp. CL154]SFL64132.1 cation-transporting ATPase E [Leifsonia sp. CL147]
MLDAETTEGLNAAQVAERVADGRVNTQTQPSSRSVSDILRENIFTLFNGILTACFVAVLLLGDLRDGFFFGIVVVNALIGIVQEYRAKRVLDRAALLAAPHSRVRRDGEVTTVALEDVVLDDLLVLRPGDQIPADAVVVESTGLSLDESMLTGESDPVFKDAEAPLLSGSHVVTGTGLALVTAVGADSYASWLTREIRKHSLVRSELRDATNRILVYLSWILGPLILVTLIGRVLTYGGFAHLFRDDHWRRALLDAVAAVVGMIPEGLVLLTSLAFGVAAIQLAARKVLVQELAAVEVLARVDVLCLDKTGTLTTGELSLHGTEPIGDAVDAELAETALAAFGSDEAGNATSGVLGSRYRSDRFRVSRRIPFSSATKYSAVVMTVDGRESSWALGAPEFVLEEHPGALERATALAATGLRTLALARAIDPLPEAVHVPLAGTRVEPALLVLLAETLRPEARDTLAYFRDQSVRVVVMSGDNPVTVAAIARELQLEGEAVDASTLTSDEALSDALETASVLGRVSPDQKRAAVRLLQERGRTVAMTGDGVNDAMAVKDADLGIAMGTGTAATKAVSRVVLLDDRFDRLPDVLAFGRRVIANVERVSNIFLAKTTYGILLALVSAFLLWPFPFLPRQLTLVSSLAIGIPSFVLALTPNKRIYTPGVLGRVLRYSVPTGLIAGVTAIVTYAPLHRSIPLHEARSVTTVALFCVSLWILCVLTRPLTGVRWLLLAAVATAFVLVCVIPFTSSFFEMHLQLDGSLAWGVVVGAAGAAGVELFYRFAKRRALVFDRV